MKVTTLNDYIKAVKKTYQNQETSKYLFFRGVSNKNHGLIPAIFRESEFKEKEVLLDYKHFLPKNGPNYSFPNDILKILTDMQHYRIPTRLLDWTISPLIALYFACNDNSSNYCNTKIDGKIYILNPWKQRKNILKKSEQKLSNIHQIHLDTRALLSYYKFKEVKKIIQKKYDYKIKKKSFIKPFPMISSFCNERIIAQKGCFTIQGLNNEILNCKEISEIIIPHSCKKSMLDNLSLLGIDDYAIFPDFEGMANSFKNKKSLFNI